MAINRRGLLALSGAGVMGAPSLVHAAAAAAAAAPAPGPGPDLLIPLWPGTPPGGQGRAPLSTSNAPPTGNQRNIDMPTLSLYRPADPDGSCAILVPGGTYTFVSMTNEGTNVAQRLTANRTTALVLAYRLPGEGWANRGDVPLQDLQRAIRLVRARATELRVDPARVGVIGFSAGGHLASNLATFHGKRVYDPVDAIDSQSARPAYAGLIYPIIDLMIARNHARNLALLGPEPTDAALNERSSHRYITPDMPPCFLAHCYNDNTAPVQNTLTMTEALRAQRAPHEAHLFQEGGHGFGVGAANLPNGLWSDMFLRWMRRLPQG